MIFTTAIQEGGGGVQYELVMAIDSNGVASSRFTHSVSCSTYNVYLSYSTGLLSSYKPYKGTTVEQNNIVDQHIICS